MSIIAFSDKQTIESSRITRVHLFRKDENLLVETDTEPPLQINGPGVHADAALLNDVRDKERLNFGVFEK